MSVDIGEQSMAIVCYVQMDTLGSSIKPCKSKINLLLKSILVLNIYADTRHLTAEVRVYPSIASVKFR